LPTGGVSVGETRFSNLYTHEWDILVKAAQLLNAMKDQKAIYGLYCVLAEEWSPSLRYQSVQLKPKQAQLLYKQMEEVYMFLKESVP
jgi:hypothetical protein